MKRYAGIILLICLLLTSCTGNTSEPSDTEVSSPKEQPTAAAPELPMKQPEKLPPDTAAPPTEPSKPKDEAAEESKAVQSSEKVRAETIEFVVTDKNSAPVPGLLLMFANTSSDMLMRESEGYTDKNGSCTLTFRESVYTPLNGEAASVRMLNPKVLGGNEQSANFTVLGVANQTIHLVWNGETPAQTVQNTEKTLTIRLVDKDKKPVQGLSISFREYQAIPEGGKRLPTELDVTLREFTGLTDAKGEFVLPNYPTAKLVLSAASNGGASVQKYTFDTADLGSEVLEFVWEQ